MSLLHQFIQETEMAATAEAVATNVVSFREMKARLIRELAAKWAENTLALGKELKAAQETFPIEQVKGSVWTRPGWKEWLEAEAGLSDLYARRLIYIAEKFGDGIGGDIAVGSFRVLDFLARDHVPEEGRQEVVERIRAGERIGKDKAVEIVNRHRPKPDEARRIARETGQPTTASDGNIYLGGTKQQEREAEERREVVYGVRRAVETLAEMNMSAEEFLAFALPHQLWNKSEEHLLQQSYNWMTDLIAAWETRR